MTLLPVSPPYNRRASHIMTAMRILLAALLTSAAALAADAGTLIRVKCAGCHSGRTPQASLDLTTAAGRARVIAPGNPEQSLLYRKIQAGQMPPGAKLSAAELETFRAWIAEAKETPHWAFVPPKTSAIPAGRNPVDHLQPPTRPQASRVALLRRVSFDLTGLPPAPAEAKAFLADAAPGAYERLVDRLLASERYGERWGRHWLDAAGYADSEGVLAADVIRPNAWRYRDYVIRAFNADMPYDQFLREQIAGDEISRFREHDQLPPRVVEQLEATGFLRTAVDATREDFQPKDFAEYTWRTFFDTMQIVNSSVLGLTMHCTRCHDHKYEPLTQKDYYGMLAYFVGAMRPDGAVLPSGKRQVIQATKTEQAHAAAVNKPLDDIVKALRDLRAARVKQYRALHPKGEQAGEAELRTEYPEFGRAVDEIARQIENEELRRVNLSEIRALYDLDAKPPAARVFLRGDPLTPGEEVQPGVPAVLRRGGEPQPQASAATTGRRTALASWLTSPDHPLTARVMVNRVWAHHFGTGIVPALDNFGRSGPPPSNQALLDHLAASFAGDGWRLKAMHRTIVTSAYYRQAAAAPRRLEAEAVRDAILAVSGTLDGKMYGEPVMTRTKPSGEVVPVAEDCHGRRSIYQIVRRSAPQSLLQSFDSPVMEINCTRRVTSASASQALAVLNSDFATAQAGHFANRVLREAEPGAEIDYAVQLAYARPAGARERDDLATFLRRQERHYPDLSGAALRWRVWADLCQALLASNEFVYID